MAENSPQTQVQTQEPLFWVVYVDPFSKLKKKPRVDIEIFSEIHNEYFQPGPDASFRILSNGLIYEDRIMFMAQPLGGTFYELRESNETPFHVKTYEDITFYGPKKIVIVLMRKGQYEIAKRLLPGTIVEKWEDFVKPLTKLVITKVATKGLTAFERIKVPIFISEVPEDFFGF